MNDTWNDYIIATYRLGGGGDWAKKAETIALGMTVGSWPGLPTARQEALDRHAGRVVASAVLTRHSACLRADTHRQVHDTESSRTLLDTGLRRYDELTASRLE